MSYQMAIMGGMAAMQAVQGVVKGAQGMADASAAAEQKIMGDRIKAAQGRTEAAGTGLAISGTQLQTAQQELQRRRAISQLWQANAIDLVGRGGVSDGTDSAAVIQAENLRIGEEDLKNIRLMGDSRVTQLSFRQTQQNLFASAQDLDALNTGDNLARQQRSMATDMLFKVLGAGASAAGSSLGGESAGNTFMRGEAKVTSGAGAFGLGPGG